MLRRGAACRGGAPDVVECDRTPFELVGVEQARRCPVAQDPRELPTEIKGVLDASVHARAATWRHPVGGVTDQPAATSAISLGDLGGESKPAEPLDLDVEVDDASGNVQQPDEVPFAQLIQARTVERALARQAPVVLASAAGEYRAVHQWMLQDVEGVATLTDRIVEISSELDALVDGQLVGAFHADAQQTAHRAVSPVSGDDVSGLHALLARSCIDHADLDPFPVLAQTDELVAEAHRRRRRRTETRQQQRLVMGLRRPRWARWTNRRGLCVGRITERHHHTVARRQRRRHQRRGINVSGTGTHGRLEPEATHQLHPASADHQPA